MANAAIYCRMSQDKAGTGRGVIRQRTDCERLANQLGWHVVATFIDNDLTACSGEPRPSFIRMLEAIKAGTVLTVGGLANRTATCSPEYAPGVSRTAPRRGPWPCPGFPEACTAR